MVPAGRTECGARSPHLRELVVACELRLQPRFRRLLSLHTSPQAESTSSSFGQPSEGLPQCSGRLKGSSSVARADAEAEEALRESKGCQHTVTSQ